MAAQKTVDQKVDNPIVFTASHLKVWDEWRRETNVDLQSDWQTLIKGVYDGQAQNHDAQANTDTKLVKEEPADQLADPKQ